MALITDYGSLQSAMADWAWRSTDTNYQAAAPQMIANFENSFKRRVRCLEMEVGPTTTSVPSPPQIVIPSDFLEVVRLQITGLPNGTPNQPLKYVTPERGAYLDATTAPVGSPQWYTIIGGKFVINPQNWVPAGATYELTYYGFTPLATAPLGVNWLITKHADLYLYGSLMEGAAYIDDKDTVAMWKAARDEALAELLEADKKKRSSGAGVLQVTPSMGFRTMRRRSPAPGA